MAEQWKTFRPGQNLVSAYFEVEDSSIEDLESGKFIAVHGVKKSEVLMGPFRYLTVRADRVWLEFDSGEVRYMKNRFVEDTNIDVDMKEFFWVKLRSAVISNEMP